MASYRDKVNQEKMETESGKIAFSIELMKRIRGLFPKRGDKVDIFDSEKYSYSIERDSLAWYIYLVNNYGETSYKVLPIFSNYETNVDILEAQPWISL